MAKPLDDIIDVFCSIADPSTMRRFFGEIFTPSERKDLALRWKLMKCLHEGQSQRQVASRLHISLCKITRGARILKKRGSVTASLLDGNDGKAGSHEGVYDE